MIRKIAAGGVLVLLFTCVLIYIAEPAIIPINWDASPDLGQLMGPEPSKTGVLPAGPASPDRKANYDTYDIKTVPILMYHQVCTPPSSGDTNLFLDPRLFAGQLDYLKKNGYTTITMQDLYDAWNDGKPLPAKPVILTFDDGYEEMYTNVLPEFTKRDMTGTFFIITSFLDQPGSLSTAQVKEMHDKGMEIGCHTYYHSSLPSANLEKELKKSREVLEKAVGGEVRFLCYPFGEYDDTVIKKAREYGYYMAVTTKSGKATSDQGFFELKRVRINCGDGAGRLQGILP